MRELFESMVERLLAEQISPALIAASERGEWPRELWQQLIEAGLPLALVSENAGGAAASWSDVFPVVVAAGRYRAPVPIVETLFANGLLDRAGLAVVEAPLTFSDAPLELVNGVVSGMLPNVPWGDVAEQVVVVAATGQLLLLPTAAAQKQSEQNIAREPRTDLTFKNVAPIAVSALPGWSNTDLHFAGAMLRAAQIAGALQQALDMAVQYAGERSQFGKEIGKFQAIQHQLAVLAENAAMTRAAADAAFALAAQNNSPFQLASVQLAIASAKTVASEAAGVGAGIAHAVHGAIGFTDEHALHYTTRRLWSWRSEFGSQTEWSALIGANVCREGAAALWPALTQLSAAVH